MGKSGEFKIRALPRGDEKVSLKPPSVQAPVAESAHPSDESEDSSSNWTYSVGAIGLLAFIAVLILPNSKPKPVTRETNSVNQRINGEVNKHLQETELKREMMVHQMELENYKFKAAADDRPSHPEVWNSPENRVLGVQMDQEDSAAKVFEDLNESKIVFDDNLPNDRINSLLERRKWVNETERAERKQLLANIIRSAYDQGYELVINQDLVVVGVKKISRTKPINIDQVIDRLAKGQ